MGLCSHQGLGDETEGAQHEKDNKHIVGFLGLMDNVSMKQEKKYFYVDDRSVKW